VRLWRKQEDGKWTEVEVLKGHESPVLACAFSPTDPDLLATGSDDETVRLWRKQEDGKWTEVEVLKGHKSCVNACAWRVSPTDPDLLATGSSDNTVRLWTFPNITAVPFNFSLENLLQALNSNDKIFHSLKELRELVGLQGVKDATALFAAYMAARGDQARYEWNNVALAGPPGTGKTRVARVLASILQDVDLVNGYAEMNVSDIKAGFVGQTYEKTTNFLKLHRGKVLFFDEANRLYTGGNDYGRDAASAMIRFLDEERELVRKDPMQRQLTVIIVAGYEADLETGFWEADPGLKRRFPNNFTFEDYSSSELADILIKKVEATKGLCIEETLSIAAADGHTGQDMHTHHMRDFRSTLTAMIEKHKDVFRSSGDQRFCNGGGMETLLQRAQQCCAAAYVVSTRSSQGIIVNMVMKMVDFEQGMQLILNRPPTIIKRSTKGRTASLIKGPPDEVEANEQYRDAACAHQGSELDDVGSRGSRESTGGSEQTVEAKPLGSATAMATVEQSRLDSVEFEELKRQLEAEHELQLTRQLTQANQRSDDNKKRQLAEHEKQLTQAQSQHEKQLTQAQSQHARQLAEARFKSRYHADRARAYSERLCEMQTYSKYALFASGAVLAVLMLSFFLPLWISVLAVCFGSFVIHQYPYLLQMLLEQVRRAVLWVLRWLLRWLGWKGWLVILVIVVLLLYYALKLTEYTMVKLVIVVFIMAGLQLFLCEWLEEARVKVS
jgi:hypothetical protein